MRTDHLPREDVVLAIADDICGCCGGPLHAIGESISAMLDWVPAQLRVVRITRPKYACRSCNKVVQAAAPEAVTVGLKSGDSYQDLTDVQAPDAHNVSRKAHVIDIQPTIGPPHIANFAANLAALCTRKWL
jgi:hypothetical protein